MPVRDSDRIVCPVCPLGAQRQAAALSELETQASVKVALAVAFSSVSRSDSLPLDSSL